jgi:aspartate/methionine/tyrosine aminotransferase
MHTILDEVYALSVYGEEEEAGGADASWAAERAREAGEASEPGGFRSAVGWMDRLGNDVHVLWGMSKDFSVSGFRVGFCYSENDALNAALDNISYFHSVSNDTQLALAQLLEDHAFVHSYVLEMRSQLRASRDAILPFLERMRVPHVLPTAGLFLWLDLSRFLPPHLDAREAEARLQQLLFDRARVVLTPGLACHAARPGFFRCCFAWMPRDALVAAFHRIERVLTPA